MILYLVIDARNGEFVELTTDPSWYEKYDDYLVLHSFDTERMNADGSLIPQT